ncbi:MAG: hypothetical protein PWP65_1700 [Clostridia bacterium]|nr:hypothetical protein [Clostridia bacterium]
MTLGKVMAAVFSAYIPTIILVPAIFKLLKRGGAVVYNYRGRPVINAGGLGLLLGAIPSLFFLGVPPFFLTALLGMALLGLLDDLLGSGEARGMRGHFARLLRGELTTGAVKALGGGFLALWLATRIKTSIAEILLAALCIALMTNTLNLLDLRPGRALKFFWLGVCAFIWFHPGAALYLCPLAGASLAYLPYEMAEEGMLGDTGANVLGLALGAAAAWALPAATQAALVAFLLLLHLYAEKYSLTRAIETRPWLAFFDRLGTGRQDN